MRRWPWGSGSWWWGTRGGDSSPRATTGGGKPDWSTSRAWIPTASPRLLSLKAGEQMGELASALKGRGRRVVSFENEDPRLLFYRCGKGSARGEGGGSILPAVGRGDAPPASSEVDR